MVPITRDSVTNPHLPGPLQDARSTGGVHSEERIEGLLSSSERLEKAIKEERNDGNQERLHASLSKGKGF